MNVLLVTRSDDNESVEMVASALRKRGAKAIRFDTDLYPEHVQVVSSLQRGKYRRTLEVGGSAFDLEDVDSLYYRRFFAGGRLPMSLGDLRDPCVDETRRTVYGAIAATDCFQLDPLWAVRRTDHKELQLKRAHEFGLEVPRTLITNEPESVLAFRKSLGKTPMITKMQHSFAVYRGGKELVVFTNQLGDQQLDESLAGLCYCPMQFQELLPKKLELRATVVGKKVFTAAIDSQVKEDTKIDWRKDGVGLIENWVPYTLPKPIEKGLLKLTKWFGLNYAAADFVVTPQGKHVFLEINAGGEFFWLQRTPGLPIAQALAEVLTSPRARAVPGRA